MMKEYVQKFKAKVIFHTFFWAVYIQWNPICNFNHESIDMHPWWEATPLQRPIYEGWPHKKVYSTIIFARPCINKGP